jgi:hypothetical protein
MERQIDLELLSSQSDAKGNLIVMYRVKYWEHPHLANA